MGPGPSAPLNPPRTGVQYVVGTPPQSPVLRPFRTRMYDREQVWGGHKRVLFFADCHRTADGRQKDKSFTNIHQSGSLGTPLEFDAVSISISPCSGDPKYAEVYEQFIHSDYVLQWYFGAQTLWSEQPISLMRVRRPSHDIIFDPETKTAYRLAVQDGKLVPLRVDQAKVPEMEGQGSLSSKLITRYIDITGLNREARRISSTESFHGEIVRGDGPCGEMIDVYVCIDGILYTTL